MTVITMFVETKMRPAFLPKKKRRAWLFYSVWRDLQGEGRDRHGYLLWERSIRRNAPWKERSAIAREQEQIAYAAAGMTAK